MKEKKVVETNSSKKKTNVKNHILKIQNQSNTDLEFGKISALIPNSPDLYDSSLDFNQHKYAFNFSRMPIKNLFFFATANFSHYLAIHQSNVGNGIIFKIGNSNFTVTPNQSQPNLIVKMLDTGAPNYGAIPFPLSNPINIDILVSNSYTNEIWIKGTLNGQDIHAEIPANTPHPQSTHIGTINANGSMDFFIMNACLPCKTTVYFKGVTPAVATHIKKNVTDFTLHKNPYTPQDINITIEPD